MTTLRLVADDLTGALDAGAQFTRSHGALRCSLGPAVNGRDRENLVINIGCRDGGEAAAVAASFEVLPVLGAGDLAFKKIDSLLRGHWVAELAVVVRSGLFATIVLAPAFPAQGRATRGGRQWARLTGRDWTMAGPDPVAALASRGISALRADDSLPSSAVPHGAVLVCDAETEADLDRIAAQAHAFAKPVLWCGSAGLARALAGAPPRALAHEGRPHLAIIGTDHAVTQAQVAHWRELAPDGVVTFDQNGAASAARIAAALARRQACLAVPDLPAGVERGEAAALIDTWLADVFGRLAPPASLTVGGGETFLALCRGLSADHLLLLGELAPGLPISRLVGGRWDGVSVLSKSGAFGHKSLIGDLLNDSL